MLFRNLCIAGKTTKHSQEIVNKWNNQGACLGRDTKASEACLSSKAEPDIGHTHTYFTIL